MPTPTFTTPPPAPSRRLPLTFFVLMEGFLVYFATLITELQAFVTWLSGVCAAFTFNATTATSTTSLAIGTGSKSLTVDTSRSFMPGMSVKVAYTIDATNWMHGDVTSYNSGTGALVVTVGQVQGSGTYTAWTITLSAPNPAAEYSKTAARTDNTAITVAECGGNYTISNTGAGGDIAPPLPAAVAGRRFRGHVTAAFYLKFIADGTDKFRVDGVVGAAGGYARANTVGTIWENVCDETGYWDVVVLNVPPVLIDE